MTNKTKMDNNIVFNVVVVNEDGVYIKDLI